MSAASRDCCCTACWNGRTAAPIGPEDIETVCIASSLHDIGKLLIPEDILTKPTALTPGEFDIVKQHTRLGAEIISDLPIYQNETIIKYALEICRWHHERWNGEGYPDGLKGEDIPIAAQVVSLADAYDALTSKRCYKEALSHEKSLEMIRGGECGSFNPLLLECLNDIADTLKHSAGAEAAVEPPAYRWAKELIWKPDDSRQELSSARMTKQVEQELSKRRFFSDLTEEFWFEYTRHPDAVALCRRGPPHRSAARHRRPAQLYAALLGRERRHDPSHAGPPALRRLR